MRSPKSEVRNSRQIRSSKSESSAVRLHPTTGLPRRTSGIRHLAAGLLASSLCLPVLAQYSIDWSTMDGGGGTSTGGDYSLSGTAGQPDAGTMSGGEFVLTGGFWSVLAVVENPPAPSLTIARNAPDSVVISWPTPGTGWFLEQNPDLTPGNWSVVAGAPVEVGGNSQVTISPLETTGYYRLRKR